MRSAATFTAMVSAVFLAGTSHAAPAQYVATVQRPIQYGEAPPPSVAFQLYKVQMLKLREAALAQRSQDGGMLTPEHDAMIQREINRITQLYQRRLQGLPA